MRTIEHSSRFVAAHLQALCTRERGASMVEYALLIGLIVVVAVVAVALFGSALSGEFSDIADSVQDVTG
jgi:Flp pilus assembly pilin Flp